MLKETQLLDEDAKEIAQTRIRWEQLEGKTILISGATGYVPQYIIHGIMKHNDMYKSNIKVIALCRDEKKALLRFGDYYKRKDFSVVIHDVCDEFIYEEDIHYIIHAASPAGVVNSNKDPYMTFKVNVMGCDKLLRVAKEKKAVFVLFSSVDVYGGNSGEERFGEEYSGPLDSLDSRNIYACAKRAAESLCISYAESFDVTVKIVRPTQIMAGGIPLNDGRLHIDFISQIIEGKHIFLKGDGSPIRSFIYITDAIGGVLTAMIEGKNKCAYNICNEELEASVFEFAKMMASCADEDIKILFNLGKRSDPAVKHAVSRVTAKSDALRKLGWKPQVSLRDACLRMMNYYGIKTKRE